MQAVDSQRYTEMWGGVNRCAPIGKLFTSQKFLPRYNEVRRLKKSYHKDGQTPYVSQHLSIMVLMDSLETMAA